MTILLLAKQFIPKFNEGVMISKKDVRTEFLKRHSNIPISGNTSGKLAEILRKNATYQKAGLLFISPDIELKQFRINCLLDGKNLLMPAPGIKEGFYLIKAHSVPFTNLGFAVSPKGLSQFGERIDQKPETELTIDLMITTALAVNSDGSRLGDGKGFFDLSCAILAKLGMMQKNTVIFAVAGEEQIVEAELPEDVWDIKMAGAITPAGMKSFVISQKEPEIFWDKLSEKQIRKINPLWKIFQASKNNS